MSDDPIVREVRRAGEKLAKRAGYDLRAFLEMMRTREADARRNGTVSLRKKPRKNGKRRVA